ncbi:MAG: hypothetical protein ACREMI_06115 [Gemmatimonadales bacterium]
MRLGHILPALGCGAFAIGCGLAEVFRSPGPRDVVLTYTGPTMVSVDDRIPVTVTVTIDGASFADPRLSVTSSDTSIIVLSPQSDTLIVRGIGFDTLTIRFVASIFTDSVPTILQQIRVNP